MKSYFYLPGSLFRLFTLLLFFSTALSFGGYAIEQEIEESAREELSLDLAYEADNQQLEDIEAGCKRKNRIRPLIPLGIFLDPLVIQVQFRNTSGDRTFQPGDTFSSSLILIPNSSDPNIQVGRTEQRELFVGETLDPVTLVFRYAVDNFVNPRLIINITIDHILNLNPQLEATLTVSRSGQTLLGPITQKVTKVPLVAPFFSFARFSFELNSNQLN